LTPPRSRDDLCCPASRPRTPLSAERQDVGPTHHILMSSDGYDLVHFNLGMARFPSDHADMAGFTSQLDAVNRLAERSSGFVWTPTDGEVGDAVAVFGDLLALANISTWRSVEELRRFVYEGQHLRALAHRREWFEPPRGPAYVLWWVPVGVRPNWVEAKARLNHLEVNGPTPHAFSFKTAFAASGLPLAIEPGTAK
jgi:hypothetical protein